jgi:hypothetical protein
MIEGVEEHPPPFYDGRGREGQPTMCGLIDVTKLVGTASSSPSNDSSSPLSVSSSPQDHGNSSPLSQQVGEENLVKTNGKPR